MPFSFPMQDFMLRRSLLATLSYFDLFDHPLTLMELARYRYRLPDEPADARFSLADIAGTLRDGAFGSERGFWFLAGRSATVAVRERRFRRSERKFRKARRVAQCMRLLPSVRLVAVCNSLAIANADDESDIDLFVVTRQGTIWATRLAVVGVLALLGLRPDARTSADKVCMSFFVSERHLGIGNLALQPDDTYLRYWIASLVPLYDAGGVMDAFLAANRWVEERVPAALGARRRPDRTAAAWAAPLLPLLRAADRVARAAQERKFPEEIRRAANAGTEVAVSDDILKFHVTDRRAVFEKAFRERITALS